jgi:NAD(P)H-dependent FMN reductase
MDLTVAVRRMTIRVLAFAASLRQASLNRRLIRVAAEAAQAAGATLDLAEFGAFEMPMFNADRLEREGLPVGARELQRRVEATDGLMIASPEYNDSLPGTLKNAIDWVSRIRPVPLRGKSALLLAASNGQFGGIRGLWQLRIPLEGLGVFVYPDMFALPNAGGAFAEDGSLRDIPTRERLVRLISGYLRAAEALAKAAG